MDGCFEHCLAALHQFTTASKIWMKVEVKDIMTSLAAPEAMMLLISNSTKVVWTDQQSELTVESVNLRSSWSDQVLRKWYILSWPCTSDVLNVEGTCFCLSCFPMKWGGPWQTNSISRRHHSLRQRGVEPQNNSSTWGASAPGQPGHVQGKTIETQNRCAVCIVVSPNQGCLMSCLYSPGFINMTNASVRH